MFCSAVPILSEIRINEYASILQHLPRQNNASGGRQVQSAAVWKKQRTIPVAQYPKITSQDAPLAGIVGSENDAR
jgi:hypothetical protein